jgi:hypothetical protein
MSQKNRDLCSLCAESELLHMYRPLVCWSGGTGFADPTWEAESEDSLRTTLPVVVRSDHCDGKSKVRSCSWYKTRKFVGKGKLYPCERERCEAVLRVSRFLDNGGCLMFRGEHSVWASDCYNTQVKVGRHVRGYIQNILDWCHHLYSSCGSAKQQ